MIKIERNPNVTEYDTITQAVKDNDGYCPCMTERNETTRCPCLEFRQMKLGYCHCRRFLKKEIS